MLNIVVYIALLFVYLSFFQQWIIYHSSDCFHSFWFSGEKTALFSFGWSAWWEYNKLVDVSNVYFVWLVVHHEHQLLRDDIRCSTNTTNKSTFLLVAVCRHFVRTKSNARNFRVQFNSYTFHTETTNNWIKILSHWVTWQTWLV